MRPSRPAAAEVTTCTPSGNPAVSGRRVTARTCGSCVDQLCDQGATDIAGGTRDENCVHGS